MITVLHVCVELTDRFGRMIQSYSQNLRIRNQYTSVNSILEFQHNQWNSVEKNYFHQIILILKLPLSRLGGHPFMTSTRRGEGVRLRWTHVDGGGGSSPMWTSTQKIRVH